jgi:hypothetical protein
VSNLLGTGAAVGSPSKDETNKAAKARADAVQAGADPDKKANEVQPLVGEAANAQAVIDKKTANRTILFWAIASICGLAVSGGFGLFLLQSITSTHVNSFLDLCITGLVIGAGTKPLHDLITNIQTGTSQSSSTSTNS